jgi:GH35 family endo-1,4-beta-xylanase
MPTVRGHSLVWGEPGSDFWGLRGGDCRGYIRALETRVRRDVKLFAGQITSYDVVNEVGASGAVGQAGDVCNPKSAASKHCGWFQVAELARKDHAEPYPSSA